MGQHLARDVVVDQLVLLRVEVALDADDALGELGVLAVRVGDETASVCSRVSWMHSPPRASWCRSDEVGDRIGDAQTARRLTEPERYLGEGVRWG